MVQLKVWTGFCVYDLISGGINRLSIHPASVTVTSSNFGIRWTVPQELQYD